MMSYYTEDRKEDTEIRRESSVRLGVFSVKLCGIAIRCHFERMRTFAEKWNLRFGIRLELVFLEFEISLSLSLTDKGSRYNTDPP